MARSGGSKGQTGSGSRRAEEHPEARRLPASRPQQPALPQSGYSHYGPESYGYADQQAPQHSFAPHPQFPAQDPYAPSAPPGPAFEAHAGQPPQWPPHAPQHGTDPRLDARPPQHAGDGYGHEPQFQEPAFGHAPDRGSHAPPGEAWPPQVQNWDLSHYSPGQADHSAGGYAPGQHPDVRHRDGLQHGDRHPQPPGFSEQPGWPGSEGWGPPGQHPDARAGGMGPDGRPRPDAGRPYEGEPTFDPRYADPGQDHDSNHDYDETVDEEPAPRRSRALIVVVALIGAVALGGGLAYAYKTFIGARPTGQTPVVRADKSPAKIKPTEAGGKDMPNQDKKFLNRLAEPGSGERPASDPASAPDGDGVARKVTTIVVNRDGSLTPQAAQPPPSSAAAAMPAAPSSSGVPGMLVDGLNTQPPPLRGSLNQEPAAPPLQAAPARAASVTPPKVADLPLPRVAPPAKKKPVARDDAAAPKTVAAVPSGGAASGSGASGYVAALSSRKSREEALKSFADLHQKYPAVLDNRTPDVREANLGDKGVWFRLIVGPPGSREAANEVCTKLKAQGYNGCWAIAY